VLHYLPAPTQTIFRCQHDQGWSTVSMELQGAGIVDGARTWHITAGSLQLFAELRGETELQTQVPLVVTPSHHVMVSHSEAETLEKFADDYRVERLLSSSATHRMELNVDSILTLHATRSPPPYNRDWVQTVYFSITIHICLLILYHCTCAYFHKFIKCFTRTKIQGTTENTAPGTNPPSMRRERTKQRPHRRRKSEPPFCTQLTH
jgi:hypothetical protein